MIQREIKFRAWDEEFGEMIYPFAGSYNPESDTSQPATTIVPDATDSECYTWIIYWDGATDKKEVRLCKGLKTTQYTGFNNEEGQGFWEGDILEHPSSNWKGVVMQGLDCYIVKWYDEEGKEKAVSIGLGVSFKKIGNIFEHPTLIPQQKTPLHKNPLSGVREDKMKDMRPIPEIVKEHVLKNCGRMPETEEEIDQYLDLINHGKEYANALMIKDAIGIKAMKKWGLETPEEIKKRGLNKPAKG